MKYVYFDESGGSIKSKTRGYLAIISPDGLHRGNYLHIESIAKPNKKVKRKGEK
jgi:hypothetical protein